MKSRILFRSIIAKKITLKMLVYYFVIYFIVLLLMLGVITPKLYQAACEEAESTINLMADEYENVQTQIAVLFEYLDATDGFYQLLSQYEAAPSKELKSRISQKISDFSSRNSLVSAVCIEKEDGDFIDSFYLSHINKQELLHKHQHYCDLLQGHTGSYNFYLTPDENPDLNLMAQTIVSSKTKSYHQQNYVFTIFYSASYSAYHCQQLSKSIFENYMITDQYDNLLYRTDKTWGTDILAQMDSTGTFRGRRGTLNGMYFFSKGISTHWTIIGFTPHRMLFREAFSMQLIIALLYLLSPILYCVFLVPATTKQLRPIKLLADTIRNYKVGEMTDVVCKTNDEIEELSHAFQDMICQINKQIENIREQEYKNAVINYKLLATQVDPHFIYNTMGIINILAQKGEHSSIIEINSALIRILRERLNTKITIYDTLKNELITLQMYKLIMDYRFQNSIQLQYDIDDSLLSLKIPKNILQPLVENAIQHGFSEMDENAAGLIDVIIYRTEEELVIEVSDNGKGIEEERLTRIMENSYSIYEDQKPHIGIDNIRQRLSYMYGDKCSFEIMSTPGYGTTVIISIPAELSV